MLERRLESTRASIERAYCGWMHAQGFGRDIVAYAGSVVGVGVAFSLVSLLEHLSVRPPVILIYLATTALCFWYGRQRAGFLAFGLSTVCLLSNFGRLSVNGHTSLSMMPRSFVYTLFTSGGFRTFRRRVSSSSVCCGVIEISLRLLFWREPRN